MRQAALTILLIFIFIFSGCSREIAIGTKEKTIPVKVMKVERKDVSRILEYVGSITGQNEAVIYPKVSGKIFEKVKAEGEKIEKGEAIAYIDRDEVGLKFEKAPIESPLKGIVGRIYIDLGSNVTTQTPIALITDTEDVEITLNVPEKYVPLVSLGQKAVIKVDAYSDEEFLGAVTEISPVLDVETRSSPVEITLDDEEHKLRSGMFAKVKLEIDVHKNVPIILKEAILGRNSSSYVYVIENNTAFPRRIATGIRQGAYFEVKEGLKGGELVVIMGQQRLKDGAKVRVEME